MAAHPSPSDAGTVLVAVAEGVHVATSPVYATTTTIVVGDRGRCLVVDPAVTAAEVAGLSAAVRHRGWRPRAVWSTHPHWDHLLDGPGLTGLPRWAGAAPASGWRERAEGQRDTDPELAAHLATRPADAPAAVTTTTPEPFPQVGSPDDDGAVLLDWDGPEVRVLRHDAHCPGHTALVVVGRGVLVAGDLLSDVEVPLLGSPVDVHRAALDRIAALVTRYRVTLVVPGHGSAGPPAPRLAADRRYLDGLGGAEPDDPRLGGTAPAWLRAADREQRRRTT